MTKHLVGKEHSSFPYPEWEKRLQFDVTKATWLELEGEFKDCILDYGAMFTSQSYALKKNDMDVGDENDGSAKAKGAFAGKSYRNLKGASTFPTLGFGLHTLDFEKKTMQILYFTIGDPVGTMYNPAVLKKLLLICEGIGEITYLQRFVQEVLKMSKKDEPTNTFPIYRWDHNRQYWRRERRVNARSLDSVVLPKEDKTSIVADWENFLSDETAAWYKDHGIPYKRSYLFYGVPGTGKTSIIQALAGKYKRKVCFLHAHHPKFTDDAFKKCMLEVPEKAVIVLEDIDALFGKDRQKKASQNVPLTFTGLLNGLDGIGHKDGMIVVATTNYIDRLDEALIRAGRMDVKVEFKRATHEQLEAMFLRFYKSEAVIAKEFADRVLAKWTESLTMSQLQQHFIDHRLSSARTCLDGIDSFDAGGKSSEGDKEDGDEKEPVDADAKNADAEKAPKPKSKSPSPSDASDSTSAPAQSVTPPPNEALEPARAAKSTDGEAPIRVSFEIGGRKIQFSCESTSAAPAAAAPPSKKMDQKKDDVPKGIAAAAVSKKSAYGDLSGYI